MRRLPLSVILLLAAAPLPAVAQTECTILRSIEVQQQNIGSPQEITFLSGAVLSCPGGRRISADNAVSSRASGILQLTGNVEFQDSARTLTAENVQYFTRNRRMVAIGNVVLVHRASNSVIRSAQLEYDEATEQRPESLVKATGGQPRAVLREAESPDSATLDAMLIEIIGESRLRGTGDARLVRDSLLAIGYVVDYAQEDGRLDVTGLGARIELPRQQLYGDSITALTGEDEEIREVLTRHEARLEAEEMRVTAPAVRLFFENGGVTRLVAMTWEPRPGALPGERPFVETEEFRMRADSLDVLAPEQRIQEATAIGDAFGERLSPDSLLALLPEAEPDVRRFIESDWMRGDTVRAYFADNPEAAQDTAAPARVMERLTALGEPAQSMYRMRDENAPDAKLSINYMVGKAIEVRFAGGRVTEVSSPDATGVFLQPQEAAQRSRAAGGGGGGR